ncbi:TetR/AcrR family transcriptional regulator [Mangrovimicrobium sediminis]|uniref:TetR/AcrR family transcriptional regulator n=1 Tax=Mangrovimicrobium sediminis TaxID=2562682 RepID=A0A4Z0LTT5_9GAMM|nr:TetR/AcrR family transcriptional regulator [Haliea sp. SAOS-164]TGD70813.1 TetR/AcrR family transcriptional regulator [Haliea sp. SAOS-164]
MAGTEKSLKASRRTPGRPRQEDVAQIDSRLLELALQEFMQHGYGGASISRMAREAGISKNTVYSRFESKQALFHAIMQQQIERSAPARLLTSGSGRPDLEAGLKAYANTMLELSQQPEFLGVNRLMYSESHRFPELGAEAEERARLGIKRISRFVSECAEADGIPCANPRGVAEVFIHMIRGWYLSVMLTNTPVSARKRRQWVDTAVHILLSSRREW